MTRPSRASIAAAVVCSSTLDRTAFYPTSGGQPFDTGRLGSMRVTDVVDEEDGSITHVVEPGTPNRPNAQNETQNPEP